MDTRVLYYGREARMSRYFGSECLKFKKSDGKPNFPDDAINEYRDYPDDYIVYMWNLSIEDRQNIQYLDEAGENKCFCCRLGHIDSPKVMAEKGIVTLIGEDTLDYDAGEFADSKGFAKVKCATCGRQYRVTIRGGYRNSYFNWELE